MSELNEGISSITHTHTHTYCQTPSQVARQSVPDRTTFLLEATINGSLPHQLQFKVVKPLTQRGQLITQGTTLPPNVIVGYTSAALISGYCQQ